MGHVTRWFVVAAIGSTVSTALAGDVFVDIGYADLARRLTPQRFPTGAPVGCYAIYPLVSGTYEPDVRDPELVEKNFTNTSPPGAVSGFSTTYAIEWFGSSNGVAYASDDIWYAEFFNWLVNLHYSTPTPPTFPPVGADIYGITVAGFGPTADVNNINRRVDWLSHGFSRLFIVAMGPYANAVITAPLCACAYNTLSVGSAEGAHEHGTTPSGLDGPGRHEPDIIAPGDAYKAVPLVAGVATMLRHSAFLDPELAEEDASVRQELVRAILMTGAKHRDSWSNGAPQSGPSRGAATIPLDVTWGADTVNVNRSHEILTGQRQPGSLTPPPGLTAMRRGWDFVGTALQGVSHYWRFRVQSVASEVCVTATWDRYVSDNFNTYTVMDLDLKLWKVTSSGTLQTLVGAPGVGVFGSGNVTSTSTVASIEHLYIRNLQPGDYVIELKRNSGAQVAYSVGVAWWMTETAPIGDVDGDGLIGPGDLAILLGSWDTGGAGDLNLDGTTDAADLAIMLGAWSGR